MELHRRKAGPQKQGEAHVCKLASPAGLTATNGGLPLSPTSLVQASFSPLSLRPSVGKGAESRAESPQESEGQEAQSDPTWRKGGVRAGA